jgi:diguanylate cyclase (GGDEF)-like protein
MSAALMTSPALPADDDYAAVLRPVRRVLTATVSSADLITLELQVCGLPQLALLVRSRSTAPRTDLALWPTLIGPGAWHDGVLLVAAAAAADAARRVAVHGAATLVADLIIAERRRVEAEALASRAVELAGVDALTGVGNRRTWRRALDEEAARASRYDRESTVVVVDLDGLKGINDADGHAAGDAHLQRAAAAVRAASRSVDIVCRLGGDEFGVLAPETGAEGAVHLAARLCTHLDEAGVQASLGVATATDGDLERAWNQADQEMYLHKRGRSPGQA